MSIPTSNETPPRLSLTVIIITLNEAANIEACIDSVSFANEVIVIDSGSQDATVELARARGAKVTVADGWPGFGPQKNRALGCANGEWILSIDADERVSGELAAEIRSKLSGSMDAFEIPRLTQFCGQWIKHCGWTPDRVLRLFRRGKARFSDDLVHERVVLATQSCLGRLVSPLHHFSYPTPVHYWRKLEHYSQAWAMQRFMKGQRTSMWRAGLAALVAFLRSYVLRLGFLDGAMGFAVCTMQAQAAFGKYFALYCLGRQKDDTSIS